MAFKLEQSKNLPSGAYRDMLYWSEGILALSPDGTRQNTENPLDPFNADSTIEEIEKKLQELHDEAISQKFTTSKIIEILLQKRRIRLEKMIAYIDVDASLHSLTGGFMRDLYDDFSLHIDAVIYSLPNPVKYLSNYDEVNKQFVEANYALDGVIDALEGAGVTKDIQDRLSHKNRAYMALHTTTDFLEAGLSNWNILQTRLEKDKIAEMGLKDYLAFEDVRLEEQLSHLRGIRADLRTRGSNSPLDEERISDIECLLRGTILKTLLTIPDQSLPGDPTAKKLIVNSKINKYYHYKSDIIKRLRTAKIALNLTLDRYALKTDQGMVKSRDVNEYLKPCSMSLEEIFQFLRESS